MYSSMKEFFSKRFMFLDDVDRLQNSLSKNLEKIYRNSLLINENSISKYFFKFPLFAFYFLSFFDFI